MKMTKRKKRRLNAPDVGLFNAPGLSSDIGNGDGLEESLLESCLAEFETKPSAPSDDVVNTKPSPVASKQNEDISIQIKSRKLDHPLKKSLDARIKEWNRRFSECSSKPPTDVLPSFDVEMARHFRVQELSSFVLKIHENAKMPMFERWLIDSKIEERQQARQHQNMDVILANVTMDYESSERLVEELLDVGVEAEVAMTTVKELCRRACAAIQELAAASRQHKTAFRKGDRIDLEKSGGGRDGLYSLLYSRKNWKKPFRVQITQKHYQKLRDLFTSTHKVGNTSIQLDPHSGKHSKALHAFHLILMVLLLRYSALSGGQLLKDLRGGGMQGAIHGHVFEALRMLFPELHVFEGFASPFNCYLPNFGSAFADIDFHFGSVGDFMDLTLAEGVCEVNPPFSPGLMDLMVQHIEENVERADRDQKALTFCVVVPTASQKQTRPAQQAALASFEEMVESPSCRKHIVLAAREHGYIEGAQHLRPTMYKDSNYDTSVILLQSREARMDESLNGEELGKAIRKAFVSKHKSELDERNRLGDTKS